MTKSLRAFLICAASVLIVGCSNERQDAVRSSHHTTTATTVSTNTQTPPNVGIFTASGAGNLKAIAQHIAAGTNLNVKEPAGGGTPLIVTTVAGQTEAARLLIDNGASLGATNNDGATALHTAAFFGHPDTVKLLLECGAEVNAKNIRGETPLDTVADEWTNELRGFYRMIAGMFQLELDFERIKAARPVVAEMLRENGGKTNGG